MIGLSLTAISMMVSSDGVYGGARVEETKPIFKIKETKKGFSIGTSEEMVIFG